jgi:5-hydroxyisourate hydrolase
MTQHSNAITTHVLDTSRGQPASGVPVWLEVRSEAGEWRVVGRASTDRDGRAALLEQPVGKGVYRITFDTEAYWRAWNLEGFYPEVKVVFEIRELGLHHHVPLLLSPYGYSTYLGS